MMRILFTILLIPLLLMSLTEIHQVIEAGLDEFTDYERPERTCNCIGCSMGMHGEEHKGEAQMCDITMGAENGEKPCHCAMNKNHGDREAPSVCSCTTNSSKQQHILYNTPDKNALIAFIQLKLHNQKTVHFRAFMDPETLAVSNDIFHPPRT
ncbi:hypothetical protein [Rhodohalobacter mucosus]|uniref:Uncharacterized protein n=1 Tax=Rhodohalobacter mucosus TaxID=2079485 RepID=A0A316TTW0_9BACT|nr:hypothetical protein [Rhodohalobacter mucosus]PWN08007.1 hypothetical protein DDZ15_03065 [Rhodohalobacter mucosus]